MPENSAPSAGTEGKKETHVDMFIGPMGFGKDKYARFVLMLFRLPAALRVDFAEWISKYRLFCTYQGKRWRVVGASRLGDVWLSRDHSRESGYDLRVAVDECSEWKDRP